MPISESIKWGLGPSCAARQGVTAPAGPGQSPGLPEKSSSFLKKRTKKLLLIRVRATVSAAYTKRTKVFCFFFQKRNTSFHRHMSVTTPVGIIPTALNVDLQGRSTGRKGQQFGRLVLAVHAVRA